MSAKPPKPHPFLDFLLDQLADVPEVRAQRMFGGFGLYSAERFFGVVDEDVAYFKVDDENRGENLKARMKPFQPGTEKPMSYYAVPVRVIEDADELCRWARRAIAVAERNPPKRKARRRPKP